ncbi:MAG: hypothetical protein GY735_06155, partial [Delftia sp.]|nr:hypothetical protein [Delftia sp.]
MNLEIVKSLLSFIAPSDVIDNFELVSIDETSDHLILQFEEFKNLVPKGLSDCDTKLNGFESKLELHTFPQKGKACYLHIYRRRWLDKETGKSHSNNYNLYNQGMKATAELGALLKKNYRRPTDTV